MESILNYLSIIMVFSGAFILLLSFTPAIKISKKINGRVHGKWMAVIYLMGLFIFGYILFDIILILDCRFPLEFVTGSVFLGGAVFVYIIINVSQNTVNALRTIEDDLSERARYAELESEVGTALTRQTDLKSQLQLCAESFIKNLHVHFACIWLADRDDNITINLTAGTEGIFQDENYCINNLCIKDAEALLSLNKPYLTNSVSDNTTFFNPDRAAMEGITSFAACPFSLSDRVKGAIALFDRKPIKESMLNVLSSISDKISRGIERKKNENRIHTLAYYDSLTGLPNRYFFLELLQKSIKYATRYKHSYAIALVDLDNFSRINDTLGHDVGDELLKVASSRLLKAIRSSDYAGRIFKEDPIARMDGDEFIVLLHELDNAVNANTAATRVLNELSRVYKFDDNEIFITVSIGIVIYPNDGTDVESLIKNAGTALYHAKKRGKNNIQFFPDL